MIGWRLFQLLLLAAAVGAAAYTQTALAPLQEAIRNSLRLTDNQVALVQGLGPALPMALCSIPIGILADRVPRTRMLSLAILLAAGSAMLSACAINLSTLFAARCLAGLSAAAIPIVAYSMAGDLFAPSERGRATMVMAIGEICGSPVAFALGGALLMAAATFPTFQIGEPASSPWRWSLLLMGIPLLPLMVMMLRLQKDHSVASESSFSSRSNRLQGSTQEAWRNLYHLRRVALPLQLGRAAVFIADGAVMVWAAPHFSRTFGMRPDTIGFVLGAILFVSGLLGPALGGLLVDSCQVRFGGSRLAVRILAILALFCVPLALFPLIHDPWLASVTLTAFLALGFAISSAALALTIVVIPGELRGLNLGFSVMIGSIFFVGLAPLAVSSLSTALGGGAMLAPSLAIVCSVASLVNAATFGASIPSFPRRGESVSSAEDQEVSPLPPSIAAPGSGGAN